MGLKQDERALLQLVCERGQSYADLAELLGIPEGDVRERARGALAELGGADPDAEVGLTDYLLGQADPIGRADAVRFLQQDPASRELAETVITKLRVIAPGAELPKLPEAKGKRRRAAAPSRAEAEAAGEVAPAVGSGETRSSHQSRLIAGLIGGGVVLVFAILAIAGVFSGEDAAPAATSSTDLADQQRTTTTVDLAPEKGSGVAGTAMFGFADTQLYVDLDLDGLDPDLDKKSAYVLWLMVDDSGGYPVSVIAPDANGRVQDRLAVPGPVRDTVAGVAQSVRVSQSSVKRLSDDTKQAADTGVPLVPFSGDNLAAGEIPLAEGVAGAGGGSGGGTGSGGGSGSQAGDGGASSGG